jgi:hypothetical protein
MTWLLHEAINVAPHASHLWVSPVASQAALQRARLVRWLTAADPPGRPGCIWEERKSESNVRIGQATIWFKSGDNPDTIYGADYASAVIDEGSRVSEPSFHAVRSTLTATRGPLRIIGNAKGRKNWFFQLGERARDPEAAKAIGLEFHKITAHDAVEAKVLDAEEVAQAKAMLPEAVFKELYLAEPSDDQGNPFGLAAIRAVIMAELAPGPAVAYGVDLAKSIDWCWLVGLNAAGRMCRSERWQGGWDATEERILAAIGNTPTLVDSTGVGDPIVERMAKKSSQVEGFKFTSQSKQSLMEGLAAAIQRQDCWVYGDQMVAELESFEYEFTRLGVKYTAPSGFHDDGVCGLALANQARAHHWHPTPQPLAPPTNVNGRSIYATEADSLMPRNW